MKSMFKSVAFMAAAALMAFAATAQAQTIDLSYKSPDNKNATSLVSATKIEVVGASLRVTSSAGPSYDIADGTHSMYNGIIQDPKFLAQFVQVGATTTWLNVNQFETVQCSANKTRVIWTGKSMYAMEDFADSCAAFNAALSRSQ